MASLQVFISALLTRKEIASDGDVTVAVYPRYKELVWE